jgi:23S rRNA (cytidine1920-2'-O)/16S rRNA (cytidine1409-2'-O)-methyltransferase
MKQRVDQLLVERGLAESRTRAQALILAGKVFSGQRRVAKSGEVLPEGAPLEVRGQDHPWVSRGGLKLVHALEVFQLSPSGRIGLDIGASTGGFTDVLLTHGAAKVHAVDVGHGQLVCDASFIGLATVLATPVAFCGPGAWAVALIKPQFEAGPTAVGRKGVVRDPAVHAEVCERIRHWWASLPGWRVLGLIESPITGAEGNKEFLIGAERDDQTPENS